MLIQTSLQSHRHAPLLRPELTVLADRAQGLIKHYFDDGQRAPSASEVANFADTPVRAAKAHCETDAYSKYLAAGNGLSTLFPTASESESRAAAILSTAFPMESGTQDAGIVVQGPITAVGFCPHHLLPVFYQAYVAYQPRPGSAVLGLSKLSRLTAVLARRPLLQEQVCADIADALFFNDATPRDSLPQIETAGAAVQLIGWHSCMASRGARSLAPTLTTALRGSFGSTHLKTEFYQALRDLPPVAPVPAWVQDPAGYDHNFI